MKIIFDCFGTLIDTGKGSVEATAKILENVHSKENPASFYKEWKALKKEMTYAQPFRNEKKLFEVSLFEMFKRYGIEADASIEVEPMIKTLFADRRAFADTKETLNKLSKMGIEYVIGSTTDTDSIMYYLELNDLKTDKVFTSEDMKVYKPDPLFYTTILKETGWGADECIFVGDNLTDDVMGPQSVGMKAILLDRANVYTADSKIKPDYVINSLTELSESIGTVLGDSFLKVTVKEKMEEKRMSHQEPSPSTHYYYKRATIEDIDELVRTRIVVLRAANKLSDDVDMSVVEKESFEYYSKSLKSDDHIAYLVYDDEKFVGAGGVSFYQVMPTYHNPTGKKAYIMNMYTAPQYRRKGIATFTLDLLVKAAKEKGISQISLEATQMGRPLYEKYGFVNMKDEMELVYTL